MYSIGEIQKQNNQTERDEYNRTRANYDVKENGDVWTRYEGRVKVIPAGEAAQTFLQSVEGVCPGQLAFILAKRYASPLVVA